MNLNNDLKYAEKTKIPLIHSSLYDAILTEITEFEESKYVLLERVKSVLFHSTSLLFMESVMCTSVKSHKHSLYPFVKSRV